MLCWRALLDAVTCNTRHSEQVLNEVESVRREHVKVMVPPGFVVNIEGFLITKCNGILFLMHLHVQVQEASCAG